MLFVAVVAAFVIAIQNFGLQFQNFKNDIFDSAQPTGDKIVVCSDEVVGGALDAELVTVIEVARCEVATAGFKTPHFPKQLAIIVGETRSQVIAMKCRESKRLICKISSLCSIFARRRRKPRVS